MARRIWCVSTSKDNSGHTIVGVLPVEYGENLAGRFNNYDIVHPCETKEYAYKLAEYWRYKNKEDL